MRMNMLISVALCLVNAGYAADEPTACTPHYDKPEYWDQAQLAKTSYYKEQWPEAKRIFYVTDGKKGWGFLNEDGSPAAESDKDTDLTIITIAEAEKRGFKKPEKPLLISGRPHKRENGELNALEMRHLTVESGANVFFQFWKPHGNVWVKEGAAVSTHYFCTFSGGKHTFLRYDPGHKALIEGSKGFRTYDDFRKTPEGAKLVEARPDTKFKPGMVRMPDGAGGWRWFECINEHLGLVNRPEFKKEGASIELIGQMYFCDALKITSGTVILAPNTCVYAGWLENTMSISGGLVLLDNTSISKFFGGASSKANIVIDGKGFIQGGLPERPLTRDCFLSLNQLQGPLAKPNFCLDAKGEVRVISADPKKARLVFLRDGREGPDAAKGGQSGITLRFSNPGAKLDGILCDDVMAKGIVVAAPGQRTQLSFGEHCAGKSNELFDGDGSKTP